MNKFLAKSNKNLSQNCGPESIRYKYRMIRLTDEQWERIRSHFPEEHIADGRPGRKPIPTRRVLEAVLWLLNTGAQWHMLPQSYPNSGGQLPILARLRAYRATRATRADVPKPVQRSR